MTPVDPGERIKGYMDKPKKKAHTENLLRCCDKSASCKSEQFCNVVRTYRGCASCRSVNG